MIGLNVPEIEEKMQRNNKIIVGPKTGGCFFSLARLDHHFSGALNLFSLSGFSLQRKGKTFFFPEYLDKYLLQLLGFKAVIVECENK